jgi:hypothetical protein
MELDELKKVWAEMETLKAKIQISDNKIKEMLKKEGQSALSKLIRVAKIYIFAAIPLGLLACLCSYDFLEAGGYYLIHPVLIMLTCLFMMGLEIYIYRLLKSIDFSTMTVKQVSEKILKYQGIIQKYQKYGTIWFIVFLGTWYFLFYQLIFVFFQEIVWEFIIIMAGYVVIGAFVIQLLFKKLFYKNIKKIQESLDELKVFEN